jgi:hypothetical protein
MIAKSLAQRSIYTRSRHIEEKWQILDFVSGYHGGAFLQYQHPETFKIIS